MIKDFQPEIGLIIRDDAMIKQFALKRVTVNTSYGPVNRCFYGEVYGVRVLLLYGRFNGQKVPSHDINHQQNIEVFKNCGVKKLIGTFVVGGIQKKNPAGSVFVIDNMIGMGNYKINWDRNKSFHNAEMITPFCEDLTNQLKLASQKMDFPVFQSATYVCFNGYPRIETSAELDFYEKMGWDIVGQTLDPEATIARLNGICYGGVAVQIDDPNSRNKFVQDSKTNSEKKYVETIKSCRARTSKIIDRFLRDYKSNDCIVCCKLKRENLDFREFPDEFYE